MKSLFFIASLLLISTLALVTADMASYQKRTAKKFFDSVKAKNPNAVELKNGVIVEWLEKGDGDKSPLESTSCSMHYHGQLKNGDIFDSSMDRGSPISFAPNQVIGSWKHIMQRMVPGDMIRIYSPSDLAYGARGSPPKIPAHSPLVFKMQMLKVEGEGKSAADARKLFAEDTVDGSTFDDVKLTAEKDFKP